LVDIQRVLLKEQIREIARILCEEIRAVAMNMDEAGRAGLRKKFGLECPHEGKLPDLQ
jgi:hypothetical protein